MAIILIDHDPNWIEIADRLIAQLREQLDPLVQRLDHIGSTAVPGLAAKPKLHIDIVAREGVRPDMMRDRLLPFGYTDHGYRFHDDEIQLTRQHASLTGQPPARSPSVIRSHRLCLCGATCEAPTDRRRFRDALLKSPELARQYDQLKRRLAAEAGSHPDWDHYISGKSTFIRATLEDAC